MKISFYLALFLLLLSCTDVTEEAEKSPYFLVDPFIGTGGHGHTHPAATLPFGMIQAGPDTRLEGWDGCSGYHNSDSALYGFSHTHLSGTGIGDYNDILFLPLNGPLNMNMFEKNPVDFDKSTEEAYPGYYSCSLTNLEIKAEISANYRSAMHRYSFKNEDAILKLDLAHRDKVISSSIHIENDSCISGSRHSKAWAEDQRLFFYAQFSEPIVEHRIQNKMSGQFENATDSLMALFKFQLKEGNSLKLKIGISAVSIEGAKKNLENEITDWNFDRLQKNAQEIWEKALGKIEVSGGSSDERSIFYTALYHSMIVPNLYSDVDGKYRGMDRKIHDSDRPRYTIFSLWDTFRAAHPLYTLIEQDRNEDFINNFQDMYNEGGRIPIWELAGNYTDCMIGYHAIPVITDAYAKGLRDYDHEAIYEAMKFSAMEDRFGLSDYKEKGFISSANEGESVSKTLEYAYDDWCIAQMARWLGHEEDYRYFIRRAQNYKNVYDPSTKFMRARYDGNWHDRVFDPYEVNFHFTEATSWQYSLFAPQDISGLIEILGGEEEFEKWLDNIFTANQETSGRDQADITGLIGQYAHGNEPSHHMAYLYSFIGKASKTQEMCRRIMKELYTVEPDGLSGNEDCGQMSAWYVMSAMGFYSVTPGSDYYVIGSPLFDEVKINLENGNVFSIKATNNSENNSYISSATLNGQDFNLGFIRHSDIVAGGSLIFNMSDKASEWANKRDARPKQFIRDHLLVPVPIISAESRTFQDKLQINLSQSMNQNIEYRIKDISEWSKYENPFEISESSTIEARASDRNGNYSTVVQSDFHLIDSLRSIEILTPPQAPYLAEGEKSLIDGLKGNDNFKTGFYQGYRDDFEAIVDLGREEQFKALLLGCVQDIKPWIWFPKSIYVYGSKDGQNFMPLGKTINKHSDMDYQALRKEIKVNLKPERYRYLKIKAEHYGNCPEWHLGAGGKAWLFIDEISLQ